MNQREELVLKILSSVDVIQGKTKFVKILHFVCKLIEKNQNESPFSFKADRYGVNSPELEALLQDLESQRVIKISKPIFSKRNDLSLMDRNYAFGNELILGMGSKIELLVQALNPYEADDVIAISYSLFPETVINSKIKPRINKKITELYSKLSSEFEIGLDEKPSIASITSDARPPYPQYNDMDMRLNMMKSLGLEELPPIIPDIIDESSGLIAKNTSILKNFNFEELLEDARRG
ncbi:MAG: hypothetical protein IIA82_01015 [Thaumarchaeota archaeon]|nr:hypothetical protein [Nitrososphaerota archaeon]